MNLHDYTRHAVRRKGTGEMLLECIMCLADGDHTLAQFMVDLGNHEAAYCSECAQTMKRNGFIIMPIDNSSQSSNGHHRHTPVNEIINALKDGKSVRDVAEETEVSKNTVLSIRREVEDELPPPVIGAPSHKHPMTQPFGAHNPIPQETKDAILAEPASVTNLQLERKYHVSVSWIGKFRKQHGIVTEGMKNSGRPKGWTYKERERNIAIEALKAGKSQYEARCLSGLSRTTIDNIVRELGMEPERIRRKPRPSQPVQRLSTDVGRPRSVNRENIGAILDEGTSVRSTAEIAGVSTNTVSRIKRELKGGDVYAQTIAVARERLSKIQQEIERLRDEETKLLAAIQALEALGTV